MTYFHMSLAKFLTSSLWTTLFIPFVLYFIFSPLLKKVLLLFKCSFLPFPSFIPSSQSRVLFPKTPWSCCTIKSASSQGTHVSLSRHLDSRIYCLDGFLQSSVPVQARPPRPGICFSSSSLASITEGTHTQHPGSFKRWHICYCPTSFLLFGPSQLPSHSFLRTFQRIVEMPLDMNLLNYKRKRVDESD